jgi:hypothetical protein
MCNNPPTFGILVRLPKQGHKKIVSNFGFGSTCIIERWKIVVQSLILFTSLKGWQTYELNFCKRETFPYSMQIYP